MRLINQSISGGLCSSVTSTPSKYTGCSDGDNAKIFSMSKGCLSFFSSDIWVKFWVKLYFFASVPEAAVAGGIMFLGCLFVPFF